MPQFVVVVIVITQEWKVNRMCLFLGHTAGGGPTSWWGAEGTEYQGACRVGSQSPSWYWLIWPEVPGAGTQRRFSHRHRSTLQSDGTCTKHISKLNKCKSFIGSCFYVYVWGERYRGSYRQNCMQGGLLRRWRLWSHAILYSLKSVQTTVWNCVFQTESSDILDLTRYV